MAQVINKVVVVGASGNVGQPLLRELLASHFTVTALTRSAASASFPSGLTVRETDYTPASLRDVFSNQDAVVSAIASGSLAEQKAVVDAAAAAGVARFIPSEFGVDTADPQAAQIVPFMLTKQQIVAHLREKESDGMSWTALPTGSFLDYTMKRNLVGWNVPERKATVYGSGDQEFETTNLPQVARAITAILKHPGETKNQYVYVHSYSPTQKKIIAALEKITGDKFELSHVDVEEMYKAGKEKWDNPKEGQGPYGNGVIDMLISAIYGKGGINNFGDKPKKWMKILELEEENLEDTLREIVGDMTPQ